MDKREKELVEAVRRSEAVQRRRKAERDRAGQRAREARAGRAKAQKRLEQRRAITAKRKRALAEYRERQASKGRDAAVAYARRYIGTTENPRTPNSDVGGPIDKWNTEVGMPPANRTDDSRNPHAYWCGSFVHGCLKAGGVDLPDGVRYCPTILVWARQGSYGLSLTTTPKPGDLALFDFGGDGVMDHVGLVESAPTNIEGNTSPGTGGSQNNGGGVYRRTRRATHYVRVTYPS